MREAGSLLVEILENQKLKEFFVFWGELFICNEWPSRYFHRNGTL